MGTDNAVELVEALADPLVDGFMGIGVLVASMLLVMKMSQSRWGALWNRRLLRHTVAGPALAAALSIPPGCSGVLMTVSMFSQKQVTYGAVIASFLSTMGDSAWLIIAADPVLAIQLKVSFVVLGLVGGYGVDFLGIAPERRKILPRRRMRGHTMSTLSMSRSTELLRGTRVRASLAEHAACPLSAPGQMILPGSQWWAKLAPCCIADSSSPQRPVSDKSPAIIWVFWAFVALGLIVELPIQLNLIDEETAPTLFGMNGRMLIGLLGFGVAAVVALSGRRHSHECHCIDPRSLRTILRHTANQAAFISASVGLLYLATAAITTAIGFDPLTLPFAGIAGIAVAALLGLLPSCGLEVIVAGLFLAGGLPLPALLTYLVSHDGAGLLPLFAVDRRSALLSTILTTIPAVVVGLLALSFM